MKFIILKDVLRKTQAAGLEIARLFEPAAEQGDFDDAIGEALEEAAQFKNFTLRNNPMNEDELVFEVTDRTLDLYLPICLKIAKFIAPIVSAWVSLSDSLREDLRVLGEFINERI